MVEGIIEFRRRTPPEALGRDYLQRGLECGVLEEMIMSVRASGHGSPMLFLAKTTLQK